VSLKIGISPSVFAIIKLYESDNPDILYYCNHELFEAAIHGLSKMVTQSVHSRGAKPFELRIL
jgi:hypothetical protein